MRQSTDLVDRINQGREEALHRAIQRHLRKWADDEVRHAVEDDESRPYAT